MTGEYDGYNVEELYALISDDDPDKLKDHSQGWSNAARVFETEYHTLDDHLTLVREKWTSKSAKPYTDEIMRTMRAVEYAWIESERRADSLSIVAANVSQANDRVREQYQEWMKKKGKATDAQEDFINKLKDGKGFDMSDFGKATFDEEAERKPFDETARLYLNNAAESHGRQMAPMTWPVRPFKPIDYSPPPGQSWDNPFSPGNNPNSEDARSYGGDTSGAAAIHSASSGPTLQSGGTTPVTTTPLPGGGTPTPVPGGGPTNLGGMPPGFPSGGTSNLGRSATPPAIRPNSPPRNTVPRSTNASRTPSLPNNRSTTGRTATSKPMSTGGRNGIQSRNGAQGRNGMPGRNGTQGRNGVPGKNGTPGRTGANRNGRGLSKSQMAPKDRTGRVRSSGEVMGRRSATAKPQTEKSPQSRQVRRSIVGRGSHGKLGGASRTSPADRTKQGFTKQVLGQRSKLDGRFSRSPVVAKRVHDSGKVFGKRPGPVSPEEERRRRLLERQDRRQAMREAQDGLSRPVIGNGIATPVQLDEGTPTGLDPVKASNDFWQSETIVTPGIIGTRRPDPVIHHDPGARTITSQPAKPEPEYNPGQTAFIDREAPKHWL